MRDRILSRWRGIVLSLIGIVAIVWLAVTGQLGLYIHPRYYEFTVVMAVLGGIMVLAAFAFVPGAAQDADGHGHDHDHDHARGHDHSASAGSGSARSTLWTALTALVVVGAVVALLVVPPSTLTTATVDQRDLNNAAAVSDAADTPQLTGGDTADFTVKDWASILRQGAGEEYFAGKSATLTGFVTPDPTDPDDVFYVARFVVTCCAVDAQPVGVPVYLPGWEAEHPVDSWVTVSGGFATNPSTTSAQAIVLEPASVQTVEQPAEPYVY
ncbi:TIGR03943 family putative permease subunit [Herbiconiux sp. YIM B11900]|uniref:TIGR03943 family putative permease subunit n=1 Tax=Herbiconiux sp. YIM B11900 TaxID=3404131 RepID=UPI003F864088